MARNLLFAANRRRLACLGGAFLSASRRARRARFAAPAALVLLGVLGGAPAEADHDPAATATIFVHEFSNHGAGRVGTYGDDGPLEPEAAAALARAGLPTLGSTPEPPPPNVVASTIYYGDTAPMRTGRRSSRPQRSGAAACRATP